MSERIAARIRCPYCHQVAASAYTDGDAVRVVRFTESAVAEKLSDFGLSTDSARQCVDEQHAWELKSHDVDRIRSSSTVLNVHGRKIQA